MRARGDARAPTATATKARVATVVALACAAVACAARAATTRDAPRTRRRGRRRRRATTTSTSARSRSTSTGARRTRGEGRWTRGARACATRAWTLARTGCGDDDDAETRGTRRRGAKARREGARENALAWVAREDVGATCGFGRLASDGAGEQRWGG